MCSKTEGLRTIACIVNMKVSYANLSCLILTNVRLQGALHLACAHFTAMSFNKSTAFGLLMARWGSKVCHCDHAHGQK